MDGLGGPASGVGSQRVLGWEATSRLDSIALTWAVR